ncbi:MAG: formylglycine-generating enzyme family protein [Methylococcales bacterium]
MNRKTLLIPDIAWVEIPAGAFLYGEGSAQQTIELPTFWIAKYPITHCQYQTFIDAGGYEEASWWRDLIQPKPENSRWPQSNRPRTNVNWYEAVAFCRWFSAMLGFEEDSIRLPSEQEWEKAARGEKASVYPWGNEYRSGFANIDEKYSKAGSWYLEQSSAVGLYPHGASPYGVEDLAGNVWEWCRNQYDKPDETIPDTSRNRRVLRGGSWFNYAVFARSDFRSQAVPVARDVGAGFRVLSLLPIPDR